MVDLNWSPPTGPAPISVAIVVSPAEQERQDHNLARYAQLQLLRKGQANTYEQTRYR
jgi:hypothetical protein